MRFPYHDAYPQQFEEMVVALCRRLLGIGVTRFSTGPDGGRDARFQGTAILWPSASTRLSGTFVIQAKHCESPIAKLSDKDFSGDSNSSVMSEELPRIRGLVSAGELDHYLLFTNRRQGAEAEAGIRSRIEAEGVKSVGVFGIENLDDLMKTFSEVAEESGLSALSSPIRVLPDDLATVINALAVQKDHFRNAVPEGSLHRVSFEEKNIVNNMSDAFARKMIADYLSEFSSVRAFLAAPDNDDVLERYTEAVVEFNEQIIAYRAAQQPIDQLLVTLQRILFDRDGDLRRHKRLTKLVMYYMYWVCDLGERPSDATTN